MNKIVVVLVTYNRLDLLKECLKRYLEQSRPPDEIIVVDNASTDGTRDYLDALAKIERFVCVVHEADNIGGSGGFYKGTRLALQHGADWVWVADDDAIPAVDALEKAYAHCLDASSGVGAICAAIYTNGALGLTNRNYRSRGLFRYRLIDVPKSVYDEGRCFEIDCFSYVGVLMRAEALKSVGLIDPGYFIWLDDVEHSWRLSKKFALMCAPDIKVEHRVDESSYSRQSWKQYYGMRNDLITLKRHASSRYVIAKAARILQKGVASKDRDYFKLCIDSVRDGLLGVTGKHMVYLP